MMTTKRVTVEAEALSIGYGKGNSARCVAEGIGFSLYEGELVLLLGRNGVGKSTLLRTLSAMQPPLAGRVSICGRDIARVSLQRLSASVSVVLTDKTFAGGLRTDEVVSLGRYPFTGFMGRLSETDRRVVHEALSAVGMLHKERDYFSRLSDGERQKVMVAKALAQESDVIILDEPTAFLDLPSRLEMLALMRRLVVERRKTVLFSTHDIEQSLPYADRLLLFSPSGLCCRTVRDAAESGALEAIFDGCGLHYDKAAMRFSLDDGRVRACGNDSAD